MFGKPPEQDHRTVLAPHHDFMPNDAPQDDTRPRHPIRVVSERTGLTPDLLRAWESRYGVVHPGRSEGGHRLYSDADVDRLRLLHRVTLSGRAIGQVAPLSTEALGALAREDDEAWATIPSGSAGGPTIRVAQRYVDEALMAVRALDSGALEGVLRQSALALGTIAYLQDVAAPVMAEVGELWHAGVIRPTHEHLASVAVRRALDWLIASAGKPANRPKIVVATPPGEHHEMGALLAAAAAEAAGWEAIYLGPNLPADDVALAVLQTGARAVALSAIFAPEAGSLTDEVRDLRSRLPPSVALIVGGGAFVQLADSMREERVIRVEDIPGFFRLLEGMERADRY